MGPARVSLRDGRCASIRPVRPADLDGLRAFFAALAPLTLKMRFHLPLREVDEAQLRAFTQVDHRNHVALVAESCGTPHGRTAIIADARYACAAGADSAEFAVVVAEEWRRIGLGTHLARALLTAAHLAGLKRLCGDTLVDNTGVRAFLRSLGERSATFKGADVIERCLETASRTLPFTHPGESP